MKKASLSYIRECGKAGEITPAYMCSKPPGYLMPDMSTEVSLTIK